MTNRIDTKALQEAIQEHSDERLQKDLREWLVYTAPIEVQDIWKRYITKVENEEIRAAKHYVFCMYGFVFFVIAVVGFSMWDMIGLEHAVRRCIK
jgi:Flp pilus assembly protein TadB